MDMKETMMQVKYEVIPLLQRIITYNKIVLKSKDKDEIEVALNYIDSLQNQMPPVHKPSMTSREFLLSNMGDLAPARQKCLDMGVIYLS